MNEFEVQSIIMQAREVKAADKFVMICILKNIDWSTWRGSVRLSYISKKYDLNIRTLHRSLKRLKNLNWIKVNSEIEKTTIEVDVKKLALNNNSDKMTPSDKMTSRSDKMTPSDKMTSRSDKMTLGSDKMTSRSDKMTSRECQNDTHNNINNINNNNTIKNNDQNLDKQANSYDEYRELYLELYDIDINNARNYIRDEKWKFLERNNAFPRWIHLSKLSGDEKHKEILARFNYVGLPIIKANSFKSKEWSRECRK